MRFDDRRVNTSGVDDLRGRRGPGGVAIGGGVGLVGLVVVLLVTFLSGGSGLPPGAFDMSQLDGGALGSQPGTVAESDLAERCVTEGAIEKYDDCYLVKIYNETDEVWAAEFAAGAFGSAEYRRAAAGLLHRLRRHRVRRRQRRGGAVLLPAR